MRVRLSIITAIFALVFSVLEINLFNLQIIKRNYYAEKAQALSELQSDVLQKRGTIFFTDRHGEAIQIALNKEFPQIYLNPKEVEGESEEVASMLASALNIDAGVIKKAMERKNVVFRPLAEKASPEQVAEIRTLGVNGVHIQDLNYRFYPYGSLAASVIGFVGKNDTNPLPTGLYGLEKIYNQTLELSKNIQLTIDRNIQSQAEQILKNLTDDYGAKSGNVIVMEPRTGKILAMANVPDFDPNDYKNYDIGAYLNASVQKIYEPGSVFKPITMAAGIDSGAITPDTTFVDTGSVTVNNKTITNWDHKAHGRVTMTNVIEQSINVGTVFAERQIGKTKFKEYVKKFGFGSLTGIDLPDEIRGSIENIERKNAADIDFATASFGQGTAVTPIQMIRAFAVLANGGFLVKPHLNSEISKTEGERIIFEDTATKVTAMMESAVEKAGVASLTNYRIAGKTGTAQIANPKGGGYLEEYNHTFIGFAPVSSPRFIALIRIERPRANLAGQTVVPSFRELARFILTYYNVPPDKIKNQIR